MWLLYNKENEYESIPVSCFKRKLSIKVENDGAAFGFLNVLSYVVCFKKVFLAGKHDLFKLVSHIETIS